MRIGASILYKNGFCYQSYGWQQLRPLGELQHAINMLEAYHIDEISIIRPIRDDTENEIFNEDIQKLQSLKTITPISFGGGIRSRDELQMLKNIPIERLVLSSAYIQQDNELIEAATELYGRQALQALLPVCFKDDQLAVFHCQKNEYIPLTTSDLEYCTEHANEVILHDLKNEGMRDNFDFSLLDTISCSNDKLILSGGIGEKTAKKAHDKDFAAVQIENRVLHQEYSVGRYKHA